MRKISVLGAVLLSLFLQACGGGMSPPQTNHMYVTNTNERYEVTGLKFYNRNDAIDKFFTTVLSTLSLQTPRTIDVYVDGRIIQNISFLDSNETFVTIPHGTHLVALVESHREALLAGSKYSYLLAEFKVRMDRGDVGEVTFRAHPAQSASGVGIGITIEGVEHKLLRSTEKVDAYYQ